MYSGRKEFFGRHIDNPNIHMGKATVIPIPDSLMGRQAGAYVPNPPKMGAILISSILMKIYQTRGKDMENLLIILDQTFLMDLED
jgi:hypothetical protein